MKERVMVLHIENFTKPLSFVIVRDYKLDNILKLLSLLVLWVIIDCGFELEAAIFPNNMEFLVVLSKTRISA